MVETPTPRPAGTARALKIALGVSLAVNLGIAGLVGGAILREGPMRDRMVRDLGFGPYAEALSPQDRLEMRRAYMDRNPGLRDLRQTMRGESEAVLASLRAQPFDPAAFRAALAAQSARIAGQIQLGQDLLADRVAAMSEPDRLAFADRLEQSMRRGPDSDRGHGGSRDGDGRGSP